MKKILLAVFFLSMLLCVSCAAEIAETKILTPSTPSTSSFDKYILIDIDGGDLSGERIANAYVDIGYGDRKYLAFTNEYGQLIKVIADEIILQDDETENVLSTGRYYSDEAKVPGTEASDLDEGHVIADSLGGVSNAYNITPQQSTLNRHGDQAYMEKIIRDALNSGKTCTDFVANITYPNTSTQIPSHYSYTYKIDDNIINDEFDNVNPDDVKASFFEDTTSLKGENTGISSGIKITRVDLKSEEVDITNGGTNIINLDGYTLISVKGDQKYTFSSYKLAHGQTVTVYGKDGSGDLFWTNSYIWNNDGDLAQILDANGKLLDEY
jgi:hypothetical protein